MADAATITRSTGRRPASPELVMRRTLAAFGVAVLVALGIAGCSESVTGTVVAKDMRDGYFYTTTQLVCDSNSVCPPIPQTHYMPESYWVEVDTGLDENNDGATDVHRAYVNSGTWYETEIGDHFDNQPKDSR